MNAASKIKEKPKEKPIPKRQLTLDEMLDEALNETFPASDAIALIQPKDHPGKRKSAVRPHQKQNTPARS
jgi:hypothetical protein